MIWNSGGITLSLKSEPMMFVMRKLIFLLSALLLCAGCDKNEGEPLDMAEQTRINNQFLGLWQEVDHPRHQCKYKGFHSNFKYTSFTLMLYSGDKIPSTYDGKPYHFEKGPECSKGTVYTLVVDGKKVSLVCKYKGLLYSWNVGTNPETWVGDPKYAYERN